MFRTYRQGAVALATAAAVFATPAFANVTADVSQIASVLQGAGYSVEVIKDAKVPALRGKLRSTDNNGYSFRITAYGCDDAGKNCKSVNLYSGFTPKQKPTLDELNTYTNNARWGRYYLDKDGDPCIEMDIDLEQGGMSDKLFLDNMEYWAAVVVDFAKFAFKKDA